jgi:hypothetical protein
MESQAHLEGFLPVLHVASVVADHRHIQQQVEIVVGAWLAACLTAWLTAVAKIDDVTKDALRVFG